MIKGNVSWDSSSPTGSVQNPINIVRSTGMLTDRKSNQLSVNRRNYGNIKICLNIQILTFLSTLHRKYGCQKGMPEWLKSTETMFIQNDVCFLELYD
jgi:hypothetical protein